MRLFGNSTNENGELHIAGINAKELINQFGSPLYVMDQGLIEENMRIFKENFVSTKVETEVIYASKAFMTVAMCQLVERNGLNLDVVSGGELYTAKRAGYPLEKTYMHGNNKTVDEIEMAIEFGVGHIIVDNVNELKVLEELAVKAGKEVNVLLRVNPGIDAHTHEYIQTSKFDSKFGESIFSEDIYEKITAFVQAKNVNLKGFHCHIGSQIFDDKPFYGAVEVMFGFAKRLEEKIGFVTEAINLGGGFGIYYANGDDPVNLETFVKNMVRDIDKIKEELNLPIKRVMIEPGRSIVANAGTTLYTVGGTKKTYSGKNYIFVDGGMTDNIRPALYQAEYEGAVANKLNDEVNYIATVAGKCCESGDVLIREGRFTEPQQGDILAIASTGAYNYSMASNYNRIKKAAVVFVKDKSAKVVVKRESYEDLVRNDLTLD